jgi:hypothetical protein
MFAVTYLFSNVLEFLSIMNGCVLKKLNPLNRSDLKHRRIPGTDRGFEDSWEP